MIIDAKSVPWTADPRFPALAVKMLYTAATHPSASVNLILVPPGAVIPPHAHGREVETAYVLAGSGLFTLGEQTVPFGAGQIVAIPSGVVHTLVNTGAEPMTLLTFFTPPIG